MLSPPVGAELALPRAEHGQAVGLVFGLLVVRRVEGDRRAARVGRALGAALVDVVGAEVVRRHQPPLLMRERVEAVGPGRVARAEARGVVPVVESLKMGDLGPAPRA